MSYSEEEKRVDVHLDTSVDDARASVARVTWRSSLEQCLEGMSSQFYAHSQRRSSTGPAVHSDGSAMALLGIVDCWSAVLRGFRQRNVGVVRVFCSGTPADGSSPAG